MSGHMWELLEGWLLAVAIVVAVWAIYSLSTVENEEIDHDREYQYECGS